MTQKAQATKETHIDWTLPKFKLLCKVPKREKITRERKGNPQNGTKYLKIL